MSFILDDGILYKKINNELILLSSDEIFDAYYKSEQLDIFDNLGNKIDLRISKISLNTKIEFTKGDGFIESKIYAIRRGNYYPVMSIDNHFINYCIVDNSWFYLNGDIQLYKEEISSLNIPSELKLSYLEYMNLSRDPFGMYSYIKALLVLS